MDIGIYVLGKTKDSFLTAGIEEYSKRLKRYASLKINYVKEKRYGSISVEKRKQLEGEQLLSAVAENSVIIALDETGGQYSSTGFADIISAWERQNRRKAAFIIGGPDGLDERVRKKADVVISFSKMTFTHDMIRMFLVEQLYRAFTIKNGEKYHK